MKHPLPPCPRGPYIVTRDETGVATILDASGNDVVQQLAGAERLAECANALAKVWFPAAHVSALESRVQHLEELRRSAWARAQELDEENTRLRAGGIA